MSWVADNKRVQKYIESFSLLVSIEGYRGENRSISFCMSFKAPMAGAGKNKTATTNVKF